VRRRRASRLAAVDVFDAEGKQVGKVKDVLIGHDGSAQMVVVAVGGFLGVGTFDSIQRRTRPAAGSGSPRSSPP
jgi:sporulation protein YlmC with PRC-barrel domain